MRSRRIIGWAAAGQMIFALSQFLMLTALTRLATPADIGRFGLATAVMTPIYWFSNLDLRVNQSTDVTSKYDFLEFLYLRIGTSLAAYGAIVLIASIAMEDGLTRTILLVYGAAKGAETISDLSYGVLQKQHYVRMIALSLSLRGALGTGIFAAILWNGNSVLAAFVGFALVWIIIAVVWDLGIAWQKSQAKLRPVNRLNLLKLFRESLPLGFSGLLAGLAASAPRFAISATMSLEALGQFTLVSYVLRVATVAISAIGQAISSKLAGYTWGGQEFAFRGLLLKLIAGVTLTGLVGVALSLVAGRQLWQLAFGDHDQPSSLLLALVIAAGTARAVAIVLQTGLMAKRRFRDQAMIRLFVAIAMLAGSFLGVMVAGLLGVAVAMTLVSTVHAFTLWNMMLGQD